MIAHKAGFLQLWGLQPVSVHTERQEDTGGNITSHDQSTSYSKTCTVAKHFLMVREQLFLLLLPFLVSLEVLPPWKHAIFYRYKLLNTQPFAGMTGRRVLWYRNWGCLTFRLCWNSTSFFANAKVASPGLYCIFHVSFMNHLTPFYFMFIKTSIS